MEADSGEVSMGGKVISRIKKFKYLESIIEERRDTEDDINHRIKVGGKNERMLWSTI